MFKLILTCQFLPAAPTWGTTRVASSTSRITRILGEGTTSESSRRFQVHQPGNICRRSVRWRPHWPANRVVRSRAGNLREWTRPWLGCWGGEEVRRRPFGFESWQRCMWKSNRPNWMHRWSSTRTPSWNRGQGAGPDRSSTLLPLRWKWCSTDKHGCSDNVWNELTKLTLFQWLLLIIAILNLNVQ